MDPPSRRRLSSPPPPRPGSAGADRISSLSDDMISLVLAHLHCTRTAVRTGLLSRRWRGLWTRQTTDLAFRGLTATTIEALLPRFAATSPEGTAFNLDICLPSEPDAAQANSLLHAAARFSPAALVFTLPPPSHPVNAVRIPVRLPCFHRATSIDMDTQLVVVEPPRTGYFAALVERLSISGRIVNVGDLVTRCPRLRFLRAKFRDLGPNSVMEALESLGSALRSREVTVSLLDICILSRDVKYHAQPGNMAVCFLIRILEITSGLSPEKLVFTNKYDTEASNIHLYLPSFRRTRSIEIHWQGITFTWPMYNGKFLVLERLCLFGCNVDNLGELVSCCPRLRVLKVDGAKSIMVHSETLYELVVGAYMGCHGIDVVTPVLKEFSMEVHAAGELRMFVSAPLVEKVSWQRFYTRSDIVFGFWMLRRLSLETHNSYYDGQDTSLLQDEHHVPSTHVLSLDMCASVDPTDAHVNFAREVEKLPVSDISVVVIRLETMGHVYGATLVRLLEASRLMQSTTRILKLTLLRSGKDEVTGACLGNCRCDQPKSWRSQSTALKHLEEVEIEGFAGEDQDFDFVELILRCAPQLKRVTLELENPVKSHGYSGCTKKIHDISMMYPCVSFRVYLDSRRLVLS